MSTIGEAKQLFNDVGSKYEATFGQNAGQLDFVTRSLDLAGAGPGVSVLDIGQGTGRPTSAMAAARGCRVHGIDVSPVMVELARRNVPSPPAAASFEVVSMFDYEPAEARRFDAAFAIFSLFQFEAARLKVLPARFARWVRPGGYLFIGVIAVDDFPPEIFTPSEEDPEIGVVTRKFMGEPATVTIATKKRWDDMLAQAGFRVVDTKMVPFQPEDCDWEPHYYITCQRVEE